MPKNNTSGQAASRSRRRPTGSTEVGPVAAPIDIAGVTGTERLESADDRSERSGHPSYEEIAQAAYERYLRRGGTDGRDFDDWIEAERELREERSR
jgi:hypothetical protein